MEKIPFKDLNCVDDSSDEETLLQGSYGTVKIYEFHGTLLAFKSLKVENNESFIEEINMMRTLRHKNIVSYVGFTVIDRRIMVAMEYMVRGNLANLLHSNATLDIFSKIRILYDIASGMAWIHADNIAHRDLKPQNLLIGEGNVVKICDFGFAKHVPKSGFEDRPGSPFYAAPEIYAGGHYGRKADVYSFSIISLNVFTMNCNPYPDFKHDSLLSTSENIRLFGKSVLAGKRPNIPEDIHPTIQSLIKRCWCRNPDERPSFKEIIGVLGLLIRDISNEFVDTTIPDPTARAFWASFGKELSEISGELTLRTQVPWRDFYCRLELEIEHFERLPENPTDKEIQNATTVQLSEFSVRSEKDALLVKNRTNRRQNKNIARFTPYFRWLRFIRESIKELLDVDGNDNYVTIENFGRLFHWCAPFRKGGFGKVIFYKKVFEFVSQASFFGFLSRDAAWERLHHKKSQYFLVRFSSQNGGLTFAFKEKGKFTMLRISKICENGMTWYQWDDANNKIATCDICPLKDLINRVKASGFFNLEKPCPGSPFVRINKVPDSEALCSSYKS